MISAFRSSQAGSTLLVMIFQSGQSGEITDLIGVLPETLPVVAVTNNEDCALTKRAFVTLLMHIASENIVSTCGFRCWSKVTDTQ